MAKPKPDFGGMTDLPDDPDPETVQGGDRTPVQSYDRTEDASFASPRRRAKAARPGSAEKASPVYVQRSLYATQETFDKIRPHAFEQRRPIQEFYREALLLLICQHGIDGGVKPSDV